MRNVMVRQLIPAPKGMLAESPQPQPQPLPCEGYFQCSLGTISVPNAFCLSDDPVSCSQEICCQEGPPQPVSCLANYNCAPQEDIVGAMCPDGRKSCTRELCCITPTPTPVSCNRNFQCMPPRTINMDAMCPDKRQSCTDEIC